MTSKLRIVLLGLAALLALAGCSGGGASVTVDVVESENVSFEMRFTEGANRGPFYTVDLTLPQGWVDTFQIRARDNRLEFEFIRDDVRRASIFTIEALSRSQYWEQIGSYPEDYVNILFTADTYFIYHLPPDAYYSGLPDDEFAAFAAEVPGIIQSFAAARDATPALAQQ